MATKMKGRRGGPVSVGLLVAVASLAVAIVTLGLALLSFVLAAPSQIDDCCRLLRGKAHDPIKVEVVKFAPMNSEPQRPGTLLQRVDQRQLPVPLTTTTVLDSNALPPSPIAPAAPLSLGHLRALLKEGKVVEARDAFKRLGDKTDPQWLEARGEAYWLASLQDLAAAGESPTREVLVALDDVRQARQDLTRTADTSADAAFWLGQLSELAEGPDNARAIYEAALQRFPHQQTRFLAALDSLHRPTPSR